MRLRDRGLTVGYLPTGPFNAITDVPGIRVGQVTWRTEEPSVQRSGATVIMPPGDIYKEPLYAGTDVLNGFGELTGQATITEWGLMASPVVLTGTRNLGVAYDAVMEHFFTRPEYRHGDEIPLPVVGECDDTYLNDGRRAIPQELILKAFEQVAEGPVEEGGVGAGTGMHLFGYKGGIGTSSRRVQASDGTVWTVGVLLNTNFGQPYQIRLPEGLKGVRTRDDRDTPPPDGSCIGVVATDAPLWPHELKRLARRIGLGLSRAGSVANDLSGEIFLAFSTAPRAAYHQLTEDRGLLTGQDSSPITPLFDAVVEAAEESVWNALLAGRTTTGVDGQMLEGFDPAL